MVPLALGTDTGGSIRIPACYCGVAGLKPSYGRISTAGVLPLAPSLDHAGPMARSAADLRLAFLALAGERPGAGPRGERGTTDAAPAAGRLPGLAVGIVPGLHPAPLAPDHRKIFERAVTAIERAGAVIRELGFAAAGEVRPSFAAIQMAEAYHVHHRVLGLFPRRAADYGADVRRRLELAAGVTLDQYLTAWDGARRARREFAGLLRQSDVLITPVTGGGPSLIASPDTATVAGQEVAFRDLVLDYTVPQNLAGLPACVIPAGFDDDGIPVGLQVTAGPGQDLTALQVASALEEVLNHGQPRWPELSQAS
jgi:aspartyl-tRNA(Asn)/glutamyl-tRNA(Gln) amidotransferase subunit A